MTIDDFTYGKEPCQVSLARIISESSDKYLATKIGRFLSQVNEDYNNLFGNLKYGSDKRMIKKLLLLLRNESYRRMGELRLNGPYLSLRSHLKNVLATTFKNHLRRFA